MHADGLFHLHRSCRTWAGRAEQTMPVSALVRQGLLTRSARLAAEELTAAGGDVQQHAFKRLERVWTRAEPAGPPLRSRIRVRALFRSMGGTNGISVLGAVLARQVQDQMTHGLAAASLAGFQWQLVGLPGHVVRMQQGCRPVACVQALQYTVNIPRVRA